MAADLLLRIGLEDLMTDPTAIDVAAREAYKSVLRFTDAWSDQDGPDSIASASNERGDHELIHGDLRDVLLYVTDLIDERDGHRKRQRESEQALMLLLLREEDATVEFTAAEIVSAPADGSFVSSHNAMTGGEKLRFVAAKGGVSRG